MLIVMVLQAIIYSSVKILVDRKGLIMDGPRRYTTQEIPLDSIVSIGDLNVRHKDITIGLDDLAASMTRYGQLQPIMVIKNDSGFEIVVGQRRYLAAKQLKWSTITATILQGRISKREATALSLIENSQRVALTPIDQEKACKFLFEELGSVSAVAKELGFSEVTVRKWLRFSTVPEKLKEVVQEGKITRDQAIRLSQHVADEQKALEIAERIGDIKPTRGQRERILQAAEEAPPSSSVKSIFTRADEMKDQREIHFILVSREKERMEKAEQRFKREADELAREATVEWLKLIEY